MKAFTFVVAALLSTTALAGDKVLTNKQGMTLYTFDKDAANVSNCYGGCAQKWPPYLAASGAEERKNWSLVERKDGAKQWAYQGKPLYTWVGDSQQGDTTGDGVGGVWHVATKAKKKAPAKTYSSSYGY